MATCTVLCSGEIDSMLTSSTLSCMVFRSATAAEDAFNSVWDYTLSGDVELCAAVSFLKV